MARRPAKTVLEIALAKGGIRKGMRVTTFVAQYTIAMQALTTEPTIEEAAAWWKENERTWYRRLAEFREIFELESPAIIAEYVLSQHDVDGVEAALGELGRLEYAAVSA